MTDKSYEVATFEPLQIVPCIGSGLRARFAGTGGEPAHLAPVVAMAVCRVRRDLYGGGKLVRRGATSREICGVMTYTEEGFAFCEDASNFLGYLQPGQEPDET